MSRAVKDLMTADPVTVAPGMSLREVAEVLSAHQIHGAPVVNNGGEVVGVISTTDIIDFVAVSPGVPTSRPEQSEWGEIEDDDVADDEEDGVPYFFDFWPDAGAELLERFETVSGPEWNVLEEHTAEEVMTAALIVIEPDAEVASAVSVMLNHRIHRLLVVQDSQLLGIISAVDLLRELQQASG